MKDFLSRALLISPFLAVLLYFALDGKEEVKAEIQVQHAEQKIEASKFDADFANAWGNNKLASPSAEEQTELKTDLESAKKKREKTAAIADKALMEYRESLSSATDDDVKKAKEALK